MQHPILVVNSGSSSMKYQLIDPDEGQAVTTGLIERIGVAGDEPGLATHKQGGETVEFDELVLQRRGTRVDDEDDAHEASAAWIAVMATVFTMSATSAPRDRSFTGLFSPCRTGPIATAPALRCTAL